MKTNETVVVALQWAAEDELQGLVRELTAVELSSASKRWSARWCRRSFAWAADGRRWRWAGGRSRSQPRRGVMGGVATNTGWWGGVPNSC